MARNDQWEQILKYAIVGGGAYVLYRSFAPAEGGLTRIFNEIGLALQGIREGLSSGLKGSPLNELPPGNGSTPPPPGANPYTMIPGLQYVQDNNNGTWTVVWAGRAWNTYNNRSVAEQVYNSLVEGSGGKINGAFPATVR